MSLLGFLLFAARASAPAATSASSASGFSAASISASPPSTLSSLFSCKEARKEIRIFVSSGEIGLDGFGWGGVAPAPARALQSFAGCVLVLHNRQMCCCGQLDPLLQPLVEFHGPQIWAFPDDSDTKLLACSASLGISCSDSLYWHWSKGWPAASQNAHTRYNRVGRRPFRSFETLRNWSEFQPLAILAGLH